jgi:tetratricopeptide (TPR) repeat protein
VKDSTRSKGVANFDQNRNQIEAALEWVEYQDETRERDLVLASFIDALSATGMVRYSIKDKLIPLLEQRVSAAQRLGLKDMEADAYDDLGIKYAYLGFLRQAIEVFEIARSIASDTSDKELMRDIENHVQLARKQLKGHNQQSGKKFALLLPLPLFQLKRWFAVINKKPFMEIMVINRIASIYLEWGRLDAATSLFRHAIRLSKEHAYRFRRVKSIHGLVAVGNAERCNNRK